MTRIVCAASIGALAAVFISGAATTAEAACQQRGVGPQLSAHQQIKLAASPIKYLLIFRLRQNGTQLTGQAEYYHAVNPPRAGTGLKGALGGKGPASGFIRGNRFEVTANWSPRSAGVYSGTIDGEGHVRGVTYDRANPGARMDRYTASPLPCLRWS